MINFFRSVACSWLFILALAQTAAAADLIVDSYFTNLTYSGTPAVTTKFGQFGNGDGTNGTASGSTLTFKDWTTTGYNFVYAPGTADAGNSSGALPTTAPATPFPNEAPGQYKASNGYGNTYLWGSKNGGAVVLPDTDPAGGNFLAADGAYETFAITQTVTGLIVGNVYTLNFWWAGAQQQGTNFTGKTSDQWKVTLGSQTFTTPVVNVASMGFSGWMQQSFNYTATAQTETLSFLAVGTPNGQPPFALLGGVTMDVVPEPSTWMLFIGLGSALTVIGVVRRRRRLSADVMD